MAQPSPSNGCNPLASVHAEATTHEPAALICGPLAIDRERYRASVEGRPLDLTYLEFELLWSIVSAGGRVVGYDSLSEDLWGEHSAGARRKLAVLVSRLRAKLGPARDLIETVRRVGYRAGAPAEGIALGR